MFSNALQKVGLACLLLSGIGLAKLLIKGSIFAWFGYENSIKLGILNTQVVLEVPMVEVPGNIMVTVVLAQVLLILAAACIVGLFLQKSPLQTISDFKQWVENFAEAAIHPSEWHAKVLEFASFFIRTVNEASLLEFAWTALLTLAVAGLIPIPPGGGWDLIRNYAALAITEEVTIILERLMQYAVALYFLYVGLSLSKSGV